MGIKTKKFQQLTPHTAANKSGEFPQLKKLPDLIAVPSHLSSEEKRKYIERHKNIKTIPAEIIEAGGNITHCELEILEEDQLAKRNRP